MPLIYNAGVYQASGKDIFAVNTLAPYILTSLIQKPKRLIYLSSGMHLQGRAEFELIKKDLGNTSYSDSKLHVLAIAKAISKIWTDVYANAVNPGWVPTKMGGKGAPDDLQKGYETQAWLATSDDDQAKVSGCYFFHKQQSPYNLEADNEDFRNKLLNFCEETTQISFPRN